MNISRRVLLLLFIILPVNLPGSAQEAPPDGSKAEQEVRQLERAWLDAYEKYDAEAMDRIVADDFVITFPNGKMQTKPQLLTMIRRPRPASASPKRFFTEDVQARVYGDVVILRGRVIEESEKDGQPQREESRYTDVYAQTNGRWQVVASHLSALPSEPKK